MASSEVRALIRKLSSANRLWGTPRIHGELRKLGISVSRATFAKYTMRHKKPSSQSRRTFLNNHGEGFGFERFLGCPDDLLFAKTDLLAEYESNPLSRSSQRNIF